MKCELCKQETNKPRKRFCGHYTIKGSCAYENNRIKSRDRKREVIIKVKPIQPKRPKYELGDHCDAAKDSGYF